jgi:hypothetical protein
MSSSVLGISGSHADPDYASRLIEQARMRHSLNSLQTAIQNGDLITASTTLSKLIQEHPECGTSVGMAAAAVEGTLDVRA